MLGDAESVRAVTSLSFLFLIILRIQLTNIRFLSDYT